LRKKFSIKTDNCNNNCFEDFALKNYIYIKNTSFFDISGYATTVPF